MQAVTPFPKCYKRTNVGPFSVDIQLRSTMENICCRANVHITHPHTHTHTPHTSHTLIKHISHRHRQWDLRFVESLKLYFDMRSDFQTVKCMCIVNTASSRRVLMKRSHTLHRVYTVHYYVIKYMPT